MKVSSNGKCIGVVTLIKKEYLSYRDIGFAFLPDFEGNGYAFESTQAILKLLREKKPVETILACTLPENRKSINLLERLGMRFSEKVKVDGEILLLYSIR